MNEFYQRNSIDFEQIRMRFYPLRDLKIKKNHPIHAIDTETYHGYARLITNDKGDSLLADNIDDYLGFLTKTVFKTSHNFAYNLRYDAQAILKYLPQELLMELWDTSKTKYQDYRIRYIPKKVLSITLHKNRYAFYDIAQFFLMSLEKAAKTYLHKNKNPEAVDATLLNTSLGYWKENQAKIIRYCITDSKLTQELGQFLQDMFKQTLHINPQNYVSPASISKQYFRKKCDIPKIQHLPYKVLRAAFNTYRGGRFEVIEKGHIGKCTLLDIKSAYSYELSNLIDITRGHWKFTKNMHKEAYYGFYLIQLCVFYRHILPLPFRRQNGVYCYPSGNYITWLTKQELEAYQPYIRYRIIHGYEYQPLEITYPFKKAIYQVFKQKEKYDKNDFRYELIKKIANALCGTFYEKHKKDDEYLTGQMFNPVYATIVTANTRIKAFKKSIEVKNPTAAFATDSILVKGSIRATDKAELGDWEKQAYGDTIILKSGVYRIANKIKTRGINRKTELNTPYGNYTSIFDYIQDKPKLEKYPINQIRPVSLGESLKKTKTLTTKDINQWQNFPYTIEINKDYKRHFNSQFNNGGEIFTKSIRSQPLIIQPKE